jgi:serine/threonine-protein kinase
LLRTFVEVCNAIEFAHSRGVIHRDLKPSNVLLGEHGEVYVLDWGIAREVDGPAQAHRAEQGEPLSSGCLGTVGYMAPEQLLELPDLDGRADVYALGCLLYEILCAQPLHPKSEAERRSTLGAYDARPSRYADNVPPELDELCVLATAPDRADRIASARVLGDAVQRYLDGDRDLALRTSLARGHLEAARAALVAGDAEDARRIAMREAGRALALDPTLVGAAELIGRLMLAPPRETPRAVVAEMEAATHVNSMRQARIGILVHTGYFLLAGVLLVLGVRDPLYLGTLAGLSAINVGLALVGTRRRPPALVLTIIFTNLLIVALFSRMFSPFLVAPGVGAVSVMAFAFHPAAASARSLAIVTALAAFAVLAPWFAEMAGWISATTSIEHGAIRMLSTIEGIANLPVELLLSGFVVLLFAIAAMLAASVARAERRARRHMLVQAWQLRQLLSVPVGRA